MNKTKLIRYLVITFTFSYALWGILLLLTQSLALKLENPLCTALMLLGSFGPMVGSYIEQKRENLVRNLADFLKKAFDLKSSLFAWLLLIFFTALFFLPPLVSGKVTAGIPFYQAVLMIPMMLFGGGMEETGWRWHLQPELEKKYPLAFAAMITSVIWMAWHLPLFLIEGTTEASTNLLSFFILLIGLSFALAVLYRVSQKVSLAILMHCVLNAFQNTLVFKVELSTSILISAFLICAALAVNIWCKRRMPHHF